jgi:outer membrane biosynthesis protein TonB
MRTGNSRAKSATLLLLVCVLCVWAAPSRAFSQSANTGFEPGPLKTELGEKVRSIVLTQLQKIIEAKPPFMKTIAQGTKLEVALDGKQYSGVAYRPFSVSGVNEGELVVKQFYIKTTSPWPLDNGVVVPSGTPIAYENGRYEVPKAAETPAKPVEKTSEKKPKPKKDEEEKDKEAAQKPEPLEFDEGSLSFGEEKALEHIKKASAESAMSGRTVLAVAGTWPGGKPRYKGLVWQDAPSGKWTYWHENGRKAYEGRYDSGKRVGKWLSWDEKGKFAGSATYKEGVRKK